jgi:hypothetical protein
MEKGQIPAPLCKCEVCLLQTRTPKIYDGLMFFGEVVKKIFFTILSISALSLHLSAIASGWSAGHLSQFTSFHSPSER